MLFNNTKRKVVIIAMLALCLLGFRAESRNILEFSNANNSYATITPVELSGDFTIRVRFASNGPRFSYPLGRVANDTSYLRVRARDLRLVFPGADLTWRITGGLDGRVNTLEISRAAGLITAYWNGSNIGSSSNSGTLTFDAINMRNVLGTITDSFLQEVYFDNAGTVTQYLIDSASTTTETAVQGSGIMTFNGVVTDDWTLVSRKLCKWEDSGVTLYTMSRYTCTDTIGEANQPPQITSPDNFEVSENLLAVGSVTAIDPEQDPITYSIAGGADQALLSVDASTGSLTFITTPDFEAPVDANGDNVYEIVVAASDPNNSTTQPVTIQVLDEIEPIGMVYYISSSDGNDNCDGLSRTQGSSGSCPKASLEAALSLINAAEPGDQILFKRGDQWHGQLNPSNDGTATDPIVIGAYGTGERALFTTSEHTTGLLMRSGSYLVFQDLEFTSTSEMDNRGYAMEFPINTYSHHITIKNCYFHDYDHGGALYANHHGILEYSTVQDMGRNSAHSQGLYIANDNYIVRHNEFINNGIYDAIGFDHSLYASGATNLLIENNVMRDAVDGIKIRRGSNVTVRGNTIYNMHMGGVSIGGDSSAGFDTALVEGNLIYACPNPITLISQSGTQTDFTENVTIKNNLLYTDFGQDTIPSFKGLIVLGNPPARDIQIHNNTLYSWRDEPNRNDVHRVLTVSAADMSGSTIYNNIFFNTRPDIPLVHIDSDIVGNIDMDYDLYAREGMLLQIGTDIYWSLESLYDDHGLELHGRVGVANLLDPFNANQANKDFHPTAASALVIDQGYTVSNESDEVDFDGVFRPQGAAWDIGAYEYLP
ncbi:MAG: right-handed parallel beta-helix repeat-containing protein [Candidatus Thiodiazotropha sp.]